jgi:catechol 2,3-dioxygenase-like lactoylglutathione lyase family enzyme
MRINRLGAMLSVSDLARTIAFYRDELGFRCGNATGEPRRLWRYLDRNGVAVKFKQAEAGELASLQHRAGDLQIFCFYPDDVVGLHGTLKSSGHAVGDLRVTAYAMKEFELRDPDGYGSWFGHSTTEPPTERD